MNVYQLAYNAAVIAAICNYHDPVIFWQLIAVAMVNIIFSFGKDKTK